MTASGALLGGVVAFLATSAFAVLAERRRFGDAAVGAEAARKLQTRPVPPVGGLAIALAWVLFGGPGVGPEALPAWFATPTSIALALAVALAVGVVDDLRADGLRPLAKLLGQACAGLVLAAPCWSSRDPLDAALWTAAGAGGAVLACNLWNTYDNADGAAAGLAGVGFAVLGRPAGLAVLGFLPWNLVLRREGEPRAYLGDGGSHLLGMAVLVEPSAWPLALLPALDLARVVVLRVRAGVAPWVGDRRHLAHDLGRRGLGPVLVALVLTALGVLPLFVARF